MPMKIAVIGCGAMGSIYAAKLAATGNDVLAIDPDQASVEQMARHGLRVTGPNSDQVVPLGACSALPRGTVASIARAWVEAGFDAAAVADIAAMQWEKLICNVAYSAPCALTHMTVGQVMDDPEMGPVSRSAASEAWAVARAS